MDIKQDETLERLIKKIENGEFTEAQQIGLLKEIGLSYSVLNKLLEEIKIEKLNKSIK